MYITNERSEKMDKELRKKLRTIEALKAAKNLVDRLPYSYIPGALQDEWCRLEEALDELEQCK